jgi:hypothetical protein
MPDKRRRTFRFASSSNRLTRRVAVAAALCLAPRLLAAQHVAPGDFGRQQAVRQSNRPRCEPTLEDKTTLRALSRCFAGGNAAVSPIAPLPALQGAQPPPQVASAWAVIASAVLPGAGQAMLRVERFVPYMAFEAYSWAQYTAHSREYRRHRNAYQELSSRVARSPFTIVFPQGDFEYYERMQHFAQSGRLEVVSGGFLDPEPDTTTFNGSVWLLARRTFWQNVDVTPDTSTLEWKRAADFYLRRAYYQPFQWSWINAPLEFDDFRRLIRRSNDSNRKSLQDLGAIIGTHMLSAVDAYVTVRLRRRLSQESRVGAWDAGALPSHRDPQPDVGDHKSSVVSLGARENRRIS